MPDIPDRDDLERLYARDLSGKLKSLFDQLLVYVGDPPDINNIPPSFWDDIGEELRPFFAATGSQIYLASAERMLKEVALEVDWGLVNEAAADWARQHAGELIFDITDARMKNIQAAIPRYFEEGWTQGELSKHLETWYSEERAAMIARTEVTNAAMQGEVGIVKELEKSGIQMVAVWQTRHDEIVCPICEPRHGKKKGDGWHVEEAAHPRCRCWLNHELVA